MLPTFIVAGATKSGTTAIYEYLKAHPQVCMAWMKEPNFFTREIPVSRYEKGLAWYESLFQTCGGAEAVGEVSPAYMPRQDTPNLIAEVLPDIQLLFLLRNPVERLYSHYRYALQRGLRLPGLDQMLEERHPELEEAIHISAYDLHLERYLQVFPKKQMSVFIYEEFRAEPQAILADIFRTLGVDPEFLPPHLGKRYNPSQQARVIWLQNFLDQYGRKLMVKDMPPPVYASLRWIRKVIWQLNSRDTQISLLNPEHENMLQRKFKPTVDYVEAYLSRSIPAWHVG